MKLRSRYPIVAVAWAAVALSMAAGAPAAETVDQENLLGASVVYASCGVGPGSLSQGFRPALTPLSAVEIMMQPSPPEGVRTLRIREGGVDGPVVGVASAENQSGWTRYEFAGGVVLIPGALYVIEIVDLFSPALIAINNTDTYAAGNAYGCTDNVIATWDVVFRTYAMTTLPTREATWGRVKSLYME